MRAWARASTWRLRLLGAIVLCGAVGCRTTSRYPSGRQGRVVTMEVTAYCPCQKCCSWTYDRNGRPVYASGPNRGKPKRVGICADGTRARKGTVAADTRCYPFGTRMVIPGYGAGVVHDRGGAILGRAHIDVFFPSHEAALRWGRRYLPVRVLPADPSPR